MEHKGCILPSKFTVTGVSQYRKCREKKLKIGLIPDLAAALLKLINYKRFLCSREARLRSCGSVHATAEFNDQLITNYKELTVTQKHNCQNQKVSNQLWKNSLGTSELCGGQWLAVEAAETAGKVVFLAESELCKLWNHPQ